VSVALSVYNGARYLEQQLESLRTQRKLPAELVCCDDCSSDRSGEILEEFAREAPFPVRVSRNKRNLGFNESFVRVARQCAGPLVAFCDQDDVWSEEKLATCVGLFAAHPGMRLAIHAAQPVDSGLQPLGGRYPAIPATRVVPARKLDPWAASPGFAMVFDKELLEVAPWENRPPSRDLDGHQMDFDEWIFLLGWTMGDVGLLDACLAQYRQHGSNLFGAPGRRVPATLRRFFVGDFATQVGRTTFASATAHYLDESAAKVPPGEARTRLAAAAGYWRDYEQLSRRRDSLYDGGGFLRRLQGLLTLVLSRAYRGGEDGGLGRVALARDLRELLLSGGGRSSAPASSGNEP
jgi:glycosyltransferase involved in cell wall biosynthesis